MCGALRYLASHLIGTFRNSKRVKPHTITHITFGIPSLDELIGTIAEPGFRVPSEREHSATLSSSSSFCIIGPDGAGKSVLALHLVSTFAAAVRRVSDTSKVLYVSTDLTYGMADSIWQNFALS